MTRWLGGGPGGRLGCTAACSLLGPKKGRKSKKDPPAPASAVSASGRAGRLGLTGGRGGAPSGKKFCLFWGGCFRLESYLQFWKIINIRLLSA